MKSFAFLFKEYRLRSGFSTLREIGLALAEKGFIFEESIFSHWQSGVRIPTNRKIVFKLIEIFIENKGITFISQANELLEASGHGYLTNSEIDQLSFSNLYLSSNDNIILDAQFLQKIQNNSSILSTLEKLIDRQYQAIYEGHQVESAHNLETIANAIIELKLSKTDYGRRLLIKAQNVRIRCLTDMFTLSTYTNVTNESKAVLSFALEKNSEELGFSYWVDSTIKRLKLIMLETEPSKDDALETLRVTELSLLHMSKVNIHDRIVAYLEVAKTALLIKDQKLFYKHIDIAQKLTTDLSKEYKFLTAMVWDVTTRGHLRFKKDLSKSLSYLKEAKKYYNDRHLAVKLYVENTELQVLRAIQDPRISKQADKLQSELFLLASISNNPYQKMRLNSTKMIGL